VFLEASRSHLGPLSLCIDQCFAATCATSSHLFYTRCLHYLQGLYIVPCQEERLANWRQVLQLIREDDLTSFFNRLHILPQAQAEFFRDLKVWMTSYRLKYLARNTEPSHRRLVGEFFCRASKELFGNEERVSEEAHRLWMTEKKKAIEQ